MPDWEWVLGQVFLGSKSRYLHDVGDSEQEGHAADGQDEQLLPLEVPVELLAVAVLQAGHHHLHHAELEGQQQQQQGNRREILTMVYHQEACIYELCINKPTSTLPPHLLPSGFYSIYYYLKCSLTMETVSEHSWIITSIH